MKKPGPIGTVLIIGILFVVLSGFVLYTFFLSGGEGKTEPTIQIEGDSTVRVNDMGTAQSVIVSGESEVVELTEAGDSAEAEPGSKVLVDYGEGNQETIGFVSNGNLVSNVGDTEQNGEQEEQNNEEQENEEEQDEQEDKENKARTFVSSVSSSWDQFGNGDSVSTSGNSVSLEQTSGIEVRWHNKDYSEGVRGVFIDQDTVYSYITRDKIKILDSNGNQKNTVSLGSDSIIFEGDTDNSGNAYFAVNNRIVKVTPSGSKEDIAVSNTSVYISINVQGNNIYAGTQSSGDVHVFSKNGARSGTYDVYSNDSRVVSIEIGSDGAIYTTSDNNIVRKTSSSGETVWSYESNGIGEPQRALAVDDNGNVYFGTYGKNYRGATTDEDGNLYKLNSNGNFEWKYSGDQFSVEDAILHKDMVIIASAGTVRAVGRDSGSERWMFSRDDLNSGNRLDIENGNLYMSSGVRSKNEGSVISMNLDSQSYVEEGSYTTKTLSQNITIIKIEADIPSETSMSVVIEDSDPAARDRRETLSSGSNEIRVEKDSFSLEFQLQTEDTTTTPSLNSVEFYRD